MPIGKNAIKRVENNGYSKVKSAAPDMENSNVIANPDTQVVEVLVKPVAQAAKKVPAKTATAVKTAVKPTAKKTPVKTAAKPAPKTQSKDGFVKFSFGDGLPYYLL